MAATLASNTTSADKLNDLQDAYNKAKVELAQFGEWFNKRPSEILASKMAGKETEIKELQDKVNSERLEICRTKDAGEGLTAYTRRKNELYANGDTKEARLKHRELIRELLDRVEIDAYTREMDFFFRNDRHPIHAKLFKNAVEIGTKMYPFIPRPYPTRKKPIPASCLPFANKN